jgi:hypothetical protein
MHMTDFEYIAFDKKTGKSIAHGRNALDVCSQVKKLQDDTGEPGYQNPPYATLFCGKAGPYIWAEKLNLRRATIIIDTHITTEAADLNPDAAQLDELRA